MCQWLKEDGVDAIHVSSGSSFPHPKNPAGDLPMDELRKTYDSLISSGSLALRNYLLFTGNLTGELFKSRWESARGPKDHIEGLNLPDARAIKQAVGTTTELRFTGRELQDFFYLDDVSVNITPVIANPEPASLMLLGSGLAFLLRARRRRRA